MERRKITSVGIVLIMVFLAIDVIFASYIFNSTVHTNAPDWTNDVEGDILASDLTDGGNAFFYGIGPTVYFSYYKSPRASQSYSLAAPVREVFISNNLKRFLARDAENNVYLFAYGAGPELKQYYTISYDEPVDVIGLVSLGKTGYTTRFATFTSDTLHVYSDASTDPLWTHTFPSLITSARISHYADIIAVGTEDGTFYVFKTFEGSISWQCHCDSTVTSVSVSPFAQYAIVGTADGSVYLYDIKQERMAWMKTLEASVESTIVRSSGSTSVVQDSKGTLYIFDKAGTQLKHLEGVDKTAISFWGELFGYTRDGYFYMERLNRSVPDWKHSFEGEVRGFDINYGATMTMMTLKDSFVFFEEDTSVLMGSRTYWAALLLLVIGEVLVLGGLFYKNKGFLYSMVKNREFLEFFVGLLGGLFVSFVLGGFRGFSTLSVIVAMGATGIASWQCARTGGGLVGAFAGYIAGFFGALLIGSGVGLYYWLTGAKMDIISSVIGTAFVGGLMGALYSLVGIVIGLAIKDYFEEYRQKKARKE
ncbi:hypothetical protein EF808_05410 [archaeon]|nr:MAG: hypothetical protein EF808_05410 [archaeon]